jgi:hypothetical protein
MDRRVLVSAVVAFSFALGCGRSAQEQAKPAEPAPPPPPAATAAAPAQEQAPAQAETSLPAPCKKTKKEHGPSVQISVGRDAQPEYDCLDIKLKNTSVTWAPGDPDITQIAVTFKNPTVDTPPDPAPGPTCTLPKKDHKAAGTFEYGITVTLKNGEKHTVDPRLIINQ